MKKDWDKLMKEYASHESILVADVASQPHAKSSCTRSSLGHRAEPLE